MKLKKIVVLLSVIAVSGLLTASLQKIETVNGVRIVHNQKGGKWGKNPQVKLELVRKFGDPDSPDQNTAFYLPASVALDRDGNIYILDSGNHRIQKFSPEGKFLATIGRQGQGPGEFNYPAWLTIDDSGNLYISDPHNARILILDPNGKEIKTIRFLDQGPGNAFPLKNEPGNLIMGQPVMQFRIASGPDEKKTGLPPLGRVVDSDGKTVREFGLPFDYGDELLNNMLNQTLITVDGAGNAILAYPFQNRIEKYSADGRLLWRADRELTYSMEVKSKGKIERDGERVLSVRAPEVNRSSNGVAVDSKGRIWVITYARQLKKEEQVSVGITMSMTMGGGRNIGYKIQGDTELRQTDAFKLEVYDQDGVLLGGIPLDIFVDGIFIYGDRLFLLDKLRGAQVIEYRIKG